MKEIRIKRYGVIGIILVVVGSCVIPGIAQTGKQPVSPSRGTWLYVGGSGPGNYSSIQDAINDATDGDTVFVYKGTYSEYIILNKSIDLIGEDKNGTTIIGYAAYTISILADQVTMNGFTIQNGGRLGEGVRIDSHFNTFRDNIVELPNDDMRISGDSNTVCDNIITGDSIFLSGDGNSISGNTIAMEYHGILLMDAWNNKISNNSFFNSGLYISLENVCNNYVTDNTVNGKPLVYLYGESDVVLDGDAGQILLVNCTNITIKGQELFNTTAGIQLVGSKNCLISGNTIRGNQFGICLTGWNNTIFENTFSNNLLALYIPGDSNTISDNSFIDDDIYLSGESNIISDNTITGTVYLSGDSNIISDNSFINNNFDGIGNIGDNNIISGNIITNNNGAMGISSLGDRNTISDNTITNNDEGILLFGDNNTVSANTIIGNSEGILSYGRNNTIDENTISNNDEGVILVFSKFTHITNNTITHNKNGTNILQTEYTTIAGNTITWNNWSGISLNCSRNNTISGNTISKNRKGIDFVSSSNNTILQNNFQRNKRHALFENCTNRWNGNYWGRPRMLPKLIFGTRMIQDSWSVLLFEVDWHPAQKPYDR